MRDAQGTLLSDNFYWHAGQPSTLRRLNDLPEAPVAVTAAGRLEGDWLRISAELSLPGPAVALMNKLTLRRANGGPRILPAYATDNYVSLLPGEHCRIEIACPAGMADGELEIALEGWNARPLAVRIQK